MEKRKILAGYNVSAGVAGAIGAIAHDAWMNPCDVVKQRLQVKGSPYVGMSYPSIISQIYRSEGIRAFYLSFPTQMATNGKYKHLIKTYMKWETSYSKFLQISQF